MLTGHTTEVDEAVQAAKDQAHGTGGRFVNGELSSKFKGDQRTEPELLQSAI